MDEEAAGRQAANERSSQQATDSRGQRKQESGCQPTAAHTQSTRTEDEESDEQHSLLAAERRSGRGEAVCWLLLCVVLFAPFAPPASAAVIRARVDSCSWWRLSNERGGGVVRDRCELSERGRSRSQQTNNRLGSPRDPLFFADKSARLWDCATFK